MTLLGIDLGGTKLAGGLFDAHGRLLDRRESLLAGRAGTDVGNLMREMIGSLIQKAGELVLDVEGVGISVPGIAHPKTGHVWAPNIPGWEDYPLRGEISDALGRIPVVVDSDRACSILGERWLGAARGRNHAIFLAVGTGIGAGIVVNGEVLRGAQDIAGATGWMALEQPFRDEFIPCGCFEYQASGNGLATIARVLLNDGTKSASTLRTIAPERLTAHDIFAAYDQKDPVATEVLHRAVRVWGAAAANFVSLFNPEVVIFGGGVFGPAIRFIDDIRREAARWAQPISMRSVEFVPSALGSDAALVGGASLSITPVP